MYTLDYWISRAAKACGSLTELGRQARISREKLNYLRNRAKYIDLETALKIEKATKGLVSRYHLCEHLDIKVREQLEQHKTIDQLKISEQVAIGRSYIKDLGIRQGKRIPRNELGQNFGQVIKARSKDIEAKSIGFSNRETYRQAKYVINHGIPELINAMDSRQIAISTAAKVASLTDEEQYQILKLNKKGIITELKRINKNEVSLIREEWLFHFLLTILKLYFTLLPQCSRKYAGAQE